MLRKGPPAAPGQTACGAAVFRRLQRTACHAWPRPNCHFLFACPTRPRGRAQQSTYDHPLDRNRRARSTAGRDRHPELFVLAAGPERRGPRPRRALPPGRPAGPVRARGSQGGREFPGVRPRGWIARIGFGNPHDPLLRQVLPLGEELNWPAGFTTDPVGDRPARRAPGLLHKYSGRALLVTTGACADPLPLLFSPPFPLQRGPAAAWPPGSRPSTRSPPTTP